MISLITHEGDRKEGYLKLRKHDRITDILIVDYLWAIGSCEGHRGKFIHIVAEPINSQNLEYFLNADFCELF